LYSVSWHVLLVDDDDTRPTPEDSLDDRPHLLPRQAPVAGADARQGDALNALGVRQHPHPCQRLLDRLVAGAGVPETLLRAQVEHPRTAPVLPEPDVARVEQAGICLAEAPVLREHSGVAVAEAPGDPRSHRSLAVAALRERLDLVGVREQVT